MSVIQYFMSGANAATITDVDGRVDRHELEGMGLLKALNDLEQIPRDATLTEVAHGPDESAGILITPNRIDGVDVDCCYREGSQLWMQSDSGRYWLGAVMDKPIRPIDVLRRETYRGYVQVINGEKWVIPIARSLKESHVTLPQDIVFANGKAKHLMRDEYRDLFDIAGEVVGKASDDPDSKAHDPGWLASAAVSAMSVNYRLWLDEMNLAQALGCSLLRTDIAEGVCNLLADLQAYYDFLSKKKTENDQTQHDSGDVSTGSEDGSTTLQAGATC